LILLIGTYTNVLRHASGCLVSNVVYGTQMTYIGLSFTEVVKKSTLLREGRPLQQVLLSFTLGIVVNIFADPSSTHYVSVCKYQILIAKRGIETKFMILVFLYKRGPYLQSRPQLSTI
jgi:hypothetical protein